MRLGRLGNYSNLRSVAQACRAVWIDDHDQRGGNAETAAQIWGTGLERAVKQGLPQERSLLPANFLRRAPARTPQIGADPGMSVAQQLFRSADMDYLVD